MYAAYQVDAPSRPVARTAAFLKDDDFLEDAAGRHNDLRGRILSYCVAGTFGLLSPMYLHASAATANWNINQIEIDDAREAAAEAPGASVGDIAHIRQVMKISVSELARVFGVSRQAVHEWIKGGALSPRNAQRLSELAQVADVLLESGVEITPQMLRRKVNGGQSLLEAVQDEGKVVELARKLVDTLSRESQQRQRLAARLAGRQKPALASSDFGAPHLNEDV
ncbi:helix-turn-helix transcriptional regulator [Ralstonia pseudosolanacearum]|uniref:helix-turn-helix domain-containing protein n=1 Tax=Ralstonia pseudosolanacearum TaxID=1310165 RepID=UPI002676BBA7|nr:helix-turn-helix transcriptional regulator [Ralstonia pseudosolanacearum]MDO3530879.1 helix-turn-helix transcriptional regulator [Ralstonia pseudosolanacearum]